jgi:acetate kinase
MPRELIPLVGNRTEAPHQWNPVLKKTSVRSTSGGLMPERTGLDLVLCLNAGSSSLKFALFQVEASSEQSLASGAVEQLGTENARARLNVDGKPTERACPNADLGEGLQVAFGLLDERGLPRPTAVGHRLVHGGREHLRPTRIDAALLASLKALVPLAPLHLPAAISGIEATLTSLPSVPQVACFDTTFHANMPEWAARLPLPAHFYDEGVRRYGFHGLSYEFVLSTLGDPPPSRVIIAHLGNGASLAAIKDGRSIDTTMGFTPGGGIMMGTRTGDLDPGLILYLLREKGYSVDSLEHLLERESGLLGVAGDSDMRSLVQHLDHDERAHLAITMMGYDVRKAIGAYVAALGGLDTLVFTGGIGEHTPAIRQAACAGLAVFGIELDPARNTHGEHVIHSDSSACRVLIVETDEDRMIARHSGALVRDLALSHTATKMP